MLKRHERYMKLFSPEKNGEREFLGYFPVSVSYRTAEEVEAGDLLYTNLRLSIYSDRRRSPSGGFRRGMLLESLGGEEKYHVLVPVIVGRMWCLKAERVMSDGDGCDGEGDEREN